VSVMRSWAWPEGQGEMSRILARANAGPKAAAVATAAACSAEQWCAAVHETSWPGGLALFPC